MSLGNWVEEGCFRGQIPEQHAFLDVGLFFKVTCVAMSSAIFTDTRARVIVKVLMG